MQSLLEDLVDPNLGPKQLKSLKHWDKQIDRILAIAQVFPEATDEVNNQLGKLTGGKLDIESLDEMIKKAIEVAEDHFAAQEEFTDLATL